MNIHYITNIMYKIANPELFRKNVSDKFLPILKMGSSSASINLEKGVYNYTIKEATQRKIVKKWDNPTFVTIYMDRMRSIYMNLKNTNLCDLLRGGDIDPQQLAFMTHQEYNPEQWRKLIETKMKRDESKYTDNIQASTSMYTCKKCKSKRCTYYEMQTRSADEPATIFVTCLDCDKHWRS